MKVAGEFTETIDFGNSDVDATIEWSAEDGYLDHLEMAVSVCHIRLTANGEKARDVDGNYRLDYVDIQDCLPQPKQQELWDKCYREAVDEINNYDPTPYEMDYNASSATERYEIAADIKAALR